MYGSCLFYGPEFEQVPFFAAGEKRHLNVILLEECQVRKDLLKIYLCSVSFVALLLLLLLLLLFGEKGRP